MIHKLKNILIAVLICAPCFVCAQTKPKRDVSKDRSVVVAKQQAQAKEKAAKQAVEHKRIEAKAAQVKRKQNARKAQTPKAATYLLVDQQTSVTKSTKSYGGSFTLTVRTDGKDWKVSYVPNWCSVTKFSDFFSLTIQENTSHDARYDSFKVTSDNQEVRIDIKQEGAPFRITSLINSAYLSHDAVWSRMRVNANVTILGAQGEECLIVAFIKDEKGNSIKASSSYSNYGLPTTNDLCVTKEIIPASDNLQNYNVSFDIPNDAMYLYKKKNKLCCQLSIYCVKASSYVSNRDYTLPFRANYKKGKVTTKKR